MNVHKMPPWQPISTAPKNHLPLLLLVKGLAMQCFLDAAFIWRVQTEVPPHYRKLRVKPTHWMPLPPAPEAE